MTYASRSWKGVETTDLVGSKHNLTVTGEVEVRRSNQTPKLAEAQPQGISPVTLVLNLTVESSGDVGNDVMSWKSVTFSKEVTERQYRDITVTGETDEQAIKVDNIPS